MKSSLLCPRKCDASVSIALCWGHATARVQAGLDCSAPLVLRFALSPRLSLYVSLPVSVCVYLCLSFSLCVSLSVSSPVPPSLCLPLCFSPTHISAAHPQGPSLLSPPPASASPHAHHGYTWESVHACLGPQACTDPLNPEMWSPVSEAPELPQSGLSVSRAPGVSAPFPPSLLTICAPGPPSVSPHLDHFLGICLVCPAANLRS